MNALTAFFTILLITFFGYIVIIAFNLLPKKEKLLTLACSYGLGIGLITMQMYIYTRLNIPWHKEILFFPWVIFVLYLLIKKKKEIIIRIPTIKKPKIIDVMLLVGIAQAFCYTVLEALLRPVSAWDAWVTWLLKSKVFFIEGKVDPAIFEYIRVNYPLVINLLGTFVYIMIGNIDDTAVLLTSSAFYAFTGLLLFAVLKSRYGVRYALVFTFLLMTTQNFVRHGGRYEAGLADLPLGYFTFCSTILLFEYYKKNSGKVFILLNVFLGLTGLIKFEGIPIGIAIGLCALFHIYKQRLYKHLPGFFLWILPVADWDIYQRIYHLRDNYFSSHVFVTSTDRITNAISVTVKELVNVKSWNLLWITYFISLLIKKDKELTIINFIILSQLGIYMLLYFFTEGNNPEGSIERLLMHIAPLAIYYIAVVSKKIKST